MALMIQTRKETSIRRRQIVSAAQKLIIKYGSEHVTVRRMAKEIGVSEGAIYRHFKSKRDILSLLVDETEKILMSDIEESFPTGSSLDNLEKMVTSIQDRKGISFQIIAEIVSLGDKKLNAKVSTVINKYISRIREIFATMASQGMLRQDIDFEAAAIIFFSITQGLATIWALSHYSFDLEEKFKPIWDLFRNAVTR